MVLLCLYIKCTLENIKQISFPLSTSFVFDLKDPTGYEERHSCEIDPSNINEMKNSRGEAHFTIKFEGQQRQSTITMIEEVKNVLKRDQRYVEEDSDAFVCVRAFECRGVDITKWDCLGPFVVESVKGTVYEDVNFDEDWYEYCEKGQETVAITDFEYEFRVEKSAK